MKVGVKIGPQGWQEILERSQAKYCEVWFRLDWKERYIPLFKYLRENKISFGLHFWAAVEGKYFPCLLTLERKMAQKTFKLLEQALDIAGEWGASYLNFHPEAYHLTLLDLDKQTIRTVNPSQPIDKEKSFNQLLSYLEKIQAYAKEKNVTPLLETVPKYMPSDVKNQKQGRLKVQKSEGLETEKFFKLADCGHSICLDLGHTMAQLISDDRQVLVNHLTEAARRLADNVGLIHVSTLSAPFIGTDSHDGILDKDFKSGVIPSKKEFIKILSIFKNKDVWLIPEPQAKEMLGNYKVLKKIVAQIERKKIDRGVI